MDIIYRIYEVVEKGTVVDRWGNSSDRTIIEQNVLRCSNRNHFKEIMRDFYGENLKFRNSSKYKIGTVYCIIIDENCNNSESYLNLLEIKCACCGTERKVTPKCSFKIKDWDIMYNLNNNKEYLKLDFCSYVCVNNFVAEEKVKLLAEKNLPSDFDGYISPDTLQNPNKVIGYIYKISKKSTKEFYVGQSIYVPIFRWGQHLKTDRFYLSDIEDYIFEVLEVVLADSNLSEREKYWIQKLYKENPELSLNISLTANLMNK